MSIFCYKKIDTATRLGDQLRQQRLEADLTLEQVESKTHIPRKYLEAIESNHYHELPKAKAHRLAYIKEFATAVGLSPTICTSQLECEEGFDETTPTHPYRAIRLFPFASISIFIRNAALFGAVGLFAFYLVWQVKGILEPPMLTIYSPEEGFVFSNPEATIMGETKPEVQITVNGQNVMVNNEGKFETVLDLSTGLNTITVLATKKHGKTTTVVRHLVVKQRAPGTQTVSLRP